MKRIVAIIIVLLLFAIAYFINAKDLVSILNFSHVEFAIVDADAQSQTVEISEEFLNQLISVLDLQINKDEQVAQRRIVEGYSPKLSKWLNINNLKTNIQLAIVDSKVIVGYPLITNSF